MSSDIKCWIKINLYNKYFNRKNLFFKYFNRKNPFFKYFNHLLITRYQYSTVLASRSDTTTPLSSHRDSLGSWYTWRRGIEHMINTLSKYCTYCNVCTRIYSGGFTITNGNSLYNKRPKRKISTQTHLPTACHQSPTNNPPPPTTCQQSQPIIPPLLSSPW